MGFWEDFLGKPTKLKAYQESFTRQSEVDLAQKTATQGLPDSYEDALRKKAVSDIYRPVDYSFFGGNAARAIAGTQQTDASRATAVSDFDMKLGMQDIQAKMQGEQQLAGLKSEKQAMEQRNRERKFQVDQQNKMAEDQWRSDLIGGLAGFAAKVAFTPTPVLAETAVGSAVGGLFGGGQPKPVETVNIPQMQTGYSSTSTTPEFETFYTKLTQQGGFFPKDSLLAEYQLDPTAFFEKYKKWIR